MSGSKRLQDVPDLLAIIHHAQLDPHANDAVLHEACSAACHLGLGGFCTYPDRLNVARELLGPACKTRLVAVVGFPFGTTSASLKLAEAEWAADQGADNIDLVPSFWALHNGYLNAFAEEIATVSAIGLPVHVVLDIARLPEDTLALAVEATIDAGATGIQSGNGFGSVVSDIQIKRLAELCRGRCAIKAVGGVSSLNQVLQLVESGAGLLGTSRGTQLAQELRQSRQ
ncbi:deoxyribose-phosphate aldolase [cyanobiont of Ornithocercus magnificus]|nr:deoxyribose-phosphate aldolase [cyanobiont of Ornithocercus magnificus]